MSEADIEDVIDEWRSVFEVSVGRRRGQLRRLACRRSSSLGNLRSSLEEGSFPYADGEEVDLAKDVDSVGEDAL